MLSRDHCRALHVGAVRVVKGRHAGKLGHYDDDAGDDAVVYFGQPLHSGYVLIKRDRLVNVTSLEHERWKRERLVPPDEDRVARPRFNPSPAGAWHPRSRRSEPSTSPV